MKPALGRGALLVLCVGACARPVGTEATPAGMIASIGSKLNDVTLKNRLGEPRQVEFTGNGPTVLFALTSADCASCANIQPEAWEVARRFANTTGQVITVIEASEISPEVDRYLRTTRLPGEVLIDDQMWLRNSFTMSVHPLAVLVSPDGTVLSILLRNSRTTLQTPMHAFLDSWNRWLAVDMAGS